MLHFSFSIIDFRVLISTIYFLSFFSTRSFFIKINFLRGSFFAMSLFIFAPPKSLPTIVFLAFFRPSSKRFCAFFFRSFLNCFLIFSFNSFLSFCLLSKSRLSDFLKFCSCFAFSRCVAPLKNLPFFFAMQLKY